MSSASLAKKRRANIQTNNQPQFTPSLEKRSDVSQQAKYTVPQALNIMESRILKLESIFSEVNVETKDESNINQLFEEYDSRFEILATQINEIKEMLLKLQAYTMDVNKTLLEERMHLKDMEDDHIEITTTNPESNDENYLDIEFQADGKLMLSADESINAINTDP